MQVTEIRPLHILVAHAEPLLAAGLRSELSEQPGIAVLSQMPDVDRPPVDIVIADFSEGVRLCSVPRPARPAALRDARVLIATNCEQERSVRMALRSGAFGYLQSGCGVAELVTAVRTIGLGGRHLSPGIAQRMAMSLSSKSLTDRENEVLELLTHGLCNKDIARKLGIALGTVKAHVKGIMSKLDASSRTHAACIASERGLIGNAPPPDGLDASWVPLETRPLPGGWLHAQPHEQLLHA